MVHYAQTHYQAWPELSIDTSVDTVILDISKNIKVKTSKMIAWIQSHHLHL